MCRENEKPILKKKKTQNSALLDPGLNTSGMSRTLEMMGTSGTPCSMELITVAPASLSPCPTGQIARCPSRVGGKESWREVEEEEEEEERGGGRGRGGGKEGTNSGGTFFFSPLSFSLVFTGHLK